ncbi:unnamed protein product [Arabis nemorensis]|uniref:Uncharacterized protein n=1 Tax=Arabis nemorensis TaxID=586526 RepID=A0A565B0Y7_9BRAS|nr:unnamed protein product [Arabis nemorensis]
MTHDTRGCPSRGMRPQHQPEQNPRREAEVDRKRQRGAKEESPKAKGTRAEGRTKPLDRASTSIPEPMPLQRNLLSELSEVGDQGAEKRVSKSSTKEWVRKSFSRNTGRGAEKEVREQSTKRNEPSKVVPAVDRAPWFYASEDEAAGAKEVLAQNRKWEQAENPNLNASASISMVSAVETRQAEKTVIVPDQKTAEEQSF